MVCLSAALLTLQARLSNITSKVMAPTHTQTTCRSHGIRVSHIEVLHEHTGCTKCVHILKPKMLLEIDAMSGHAGCCTHHISSMHTAAHTAVH